MALLSTRLYIEVKLCNSLKQGCPSKKVQAYRKEPTRTYRSLQGVSQYSQVSAKQPSATTRSTAVGRLGLPELEREPWRYISEEQSREKLREHRSQPKSTKNSICHLKDGSSMSVKCQSTSKVMICRPMLPLVPYHKILV